MYNHRTIMKSFLFTCSFIVTCSLWGIPAKCANLSHSHNRDVNIRSTLFRKHMRLTSMRTHSELQPILKLYSRTATPLTSNGLTRLNVVVTSMAFSLRGINPDRLIHPLSRFWAFLGFIDKQDDFAETKSPPMSFVLYACNFLYRYHIS
jgi:hypothetical protein